ALLLITALLCSALLHLQFRSVPHLARIFSSLLHLLLPSSPVTVPFHAETVTTEYSERRDSEYHTSNTHTHWFVTREELTAVYFFLNAV
ncbi:hypothetical protein BZA77DRAFT_309043, partial [Pyronema omphalodes]